MVEVTRCRCRLRQYHGTCGLGPAKQETWQVPDGHPQNVGGTLPPFESNITYVVVDQRLFFDFSTSKLGEMVQFDSCFFKGVETNKY